MCIIFEKLRLPESLFVECILHLQTVTIMHVIL